MPLPPELYSLLYPESTPLRSGYIQVSDLHRIYWETHGNPEGVPVVCLHGGPGSGMSSWHPRLFDPAKTHIIMFDQRGCGRSEPFGELRENTTPHLVADMEALRSEIGIESWFVFGGSWGSTLALAYADAHPVRVRGLLLYGIFLGRQKELDATFRPDGPAALLYPEYYAEFLQPLAPSDHKDPIAGYRKLFLSGDAASRQDAVRRWSHWEMRLLSLIPEEESFAPEAEDPDFMATQALFEHHYFLENAFLEGNEILKRGGQTLADKPVHIIQGRYDLICPPQTAWELYRAVPHSTLEMIPDAGHSAKTPATMSALLRRAAELLDRAL